MYRSAALNYPMTGDSVLDDPSGTKRALITERPSDPRQGRSH